MDYKPGDRVRLRQDSHVATQPGVGPGMEGTVMDDEGQNPRRVKDGKPVERYYIVLFDGLERPDVVEESALEPA